MLRAAAFMALLYAATLAGFETYLNWGQWQWWPWWLVDYVSAGLLVVGAALAFRGADRAPQLLAGGWGFAIAMMWMSLASNIEAGADPERAGRVAGLYAALIAFAMLWSVAGLALTLSAQPRSQSKL